MKLRIVFKVVFEVILLTLILSNVGCRNDLQLPNVDKSLASKDGNFKLYVGGSSKLTDRVDIQIKIDGKVVVAEYFDLDPKTRYGISRQKAFVFSLPKGQHTIDIHSDQESISLKESFTISDRHWSSVAFWKHPESTDAQSKTISGFEFHIQDKVIMFL